MDIVVQLSYVSSGSGPFNLYYNIPDPPYSIIFDANVSSVDLLAGKTYTVPDNTVSVDINSVGTCNNSINILCS